MTPSTLPRCPGRCGRPAPKGRHACTRCLARLPAELRTALNTVGSHNARTVAATEARDWLLENPAPHDPDAKIAGECEHCHEPLLWLTTDAGKRMPVNADPDPARGNVLRTSQGAGVLGPTQADAARADGKQLYLHHKVTCPYADRWATPKPAAKGRKAARR